MRENKRHSLRASEEELLFETGEMKSHSLEIPPHILLLQLPAVPVPKGSRGWARLSVA